MKQYNFIKNNPVARFYYKGDHTHPVRRTVLIIEIKKDKITGYELREGAIARDFKDAPIKSYSRSKIARVGDLDQRRALRNKAKSLKTSTFVRSDLNNLIIFGA